MKKKKVKVSTLFKLPKTISFFSLFFFSNITHPIIMVYFVCVLSYYVIFFKEFICIFENMCVYEIKVVLESIIQNGYPVLRVI